MPAARSTASRATVYAVALVVLGLIAWLGHRLAAGSEQHSYGAGSVAPQSVAVTRGHTYAIAIHGGVATEAERGLKPADLTCVGASPGAGSAPLKITAEAAGSKATNQIASFDAPATGQLQVRCTGLSEVFVDNADDADSDLSGLLLLVATVALGVGLPLALSVLRRRAEAGEPAGDAAPSTA